MQIQRIKFSKLHSNENAIISIIITQIIISSKWSCHFNSGCFYFHWQCRCRRIYIYILIWNIIFVQQDTYSYSIAYNNNNTYLLFKFCTFLPKIVQWMGAFKNFLHIYFLYMCIYGWTKHENLFFAFKNILHFTILWYFCASSLLYICGWVRINVCALFALCYKVFIFRSPFAVFHTLHMMRCEKVMHVKWILPIQTEEKV